MDLDSEQNNADKQNADLETSIYRSRSRTHWPDPLYAPFCLLTSVCVRTKQGQRKYTYTYKAVWV